MMYLTRLTLTRALASAVSKGVFLAAVLTLVAAPAFVAPTHAAKGTTTIDVTDYGADPTGTHDSAAAVKRALQEAREVAGPVRIVFPHGTYQLYPEHAEQRELYMSNTVGADQRYRYKRIGILVEDMENVTIDGSGSRLLYHGFQTAFATLQSTNVRFQNFSFDYVSPKVIDATVSEAGVEDGHAYRILSLASDTHYRVDGTRVIWRGEYRPGTTTPYWSGVNGMRYTQIHDPEKQISYRANNPLFTGVTQMTDLGDQKVRIDYEGNSAPNDEGLVYQMREDTRDTAAAFFWESEDVTVNRVDAHYLHGFGYLGQFSRDITIKHSTFRADPRTGRSTAGFADFVQMSGVAGKVILRDNVFDLAHDDPINIHGTYVELTGHPKPNVLTLEYRHPQTAGFPQFYPGNAIEIVSQATMLPVPDVDAKVTAVDGPSGTDHDRSLTTMTVTFDKAIPASVTPGEYVVENTTYTPEVLIEGNTFRNNPTRGILVTTRRPVVIQDNVFDGQQMSSIFISSDAYQWYESGPVQDVTIRRNTFLRPAGPVIFVEPTNRLVDANLPVHRNIRVVDNDFVAGDVQLVNAKSVQGLTMADNQVQRVDRNRAIAVRTRNLCPAVGDKIQVRTVRTVGNHSSPAYVLRGDSDVRIADNRYDPGFNLRVNLDRTDPDEVAIENEGTTNGRDALVPFPTRATYSSDRPNVVKVHRNGTIRAKKAGTARVRATVQTQTGPMLSRPTTITVGGKSGAPECTQPPTLSDSWTLVRDEPANRAITDAGALSLTPSHGFLWDYQNNARNVVLSEAGDGTGTATVQMEGRTRLGYAEAGLVLYGDDDNYVALQRKHNAGHPTLTVVSEFAGRPEESRRITDPAQQDVWLRLTRSDDTVTASYSLDGQNFTEIGTPMATAALGEARFGVLTGIESGTSPSTTFTFDQFTEDDTPVPFQSDW